MMSDLAPRRARQVARVMRDDAAEWRIPKGAIPWLLGLPLVAVVLLALAVPHPNLYHFLIDEDHVVEWTQFFAILAASVVFALAGREAFRIGRRPLGILFAIVALGAFAVAGEEISWGQRLLGLATPDALKNINHQGETNIHNISGLQSVFNLGELLVGLDGLAVPILWAIPQIRARIARVDRLLVPPLCLATLFLLPVAYRAYRAIVLPEAGERITEFGELPELTLYLAILITGFVIWRALRRTVRTEAA